eukprot:6906253-Prymnesium_polylepis.1
MLRRSVQRPCRRRYRRLIWRRGGCVRGVSSVSPEVVHGRVGPCVDRRWMSAVVWRRTGELALHVEVLEDRSTRGRLTRRR